MNGWTYTDAAHMTAEIRQDYENFSIVGTVTRRYPWPEGNHYTAKVSFTRIHDLNGTHTETYEERFDTEKEAKAYVAQTAGRFLINTLVVKTTAIDIGAYNVR